MMKKVIFILMALLLFQQYGTISAQKGKSNSEPFRYEANWESIRSGYKCPEWYRDAKFGIFVIWGAFSVPAQGSEKYGKFMYLDGDIAKFGMNVQAYHKENYGDISEFGYKDFFADFKMERYDPDAWADLFRRSGAKYVIPMADYHDAYAMYDSELTRWNVVDIGPKKDIMRMLEQSVRAEGLKFGVSSHLANWRGYYPKIKGCDTSDPEYHDLYWKPVERGSSASPEFLDTWWARTTEAIDKYEPDVLWFDFGIDKPGFESIHAPILAYYYNKGLEWNKGVVLNGKNMNGGSWRNGVFILDPSVETSFPEDLIVLDLERGRLNDINPLPWQTDTPVSTNSWGYIKNDLYKSSGYLVDELIDITSKNGCLLLAVGPKADGSIDPESTRILLEMGVWLERNGEAVYATRPWKIYGEGPTKVAAGNHSEAYNPDHVAADFRFTTKGNNLYAISLGWPQNGIFNIRSLAKENPYETRTIRSVEFVSGGKIKWEQKDNGLEIRALDGKPCEAAYAFRIRFENND